jgi:hypothetical protein
MENKTDDRLYEWANETQDGVKTEWIRENIKDLMNEFVEDNQAEFNEMLDNQVIDEERPLDYWKEIFCKEEMEQDFRDFVDDSFKDSQDIQETERSLRLG